MAAEEKQTCYGGSVAQNYQVYLEHSEQYKASVQFFHNILPGEFKRIGAGKSSLDVLGVGSGGGELDVQILTLLQSTFPAVPITADVVEGSSQFTDNFKALVAKTTNLQKIPFAWHIMPSEDYERQVKAKGDMKRFDFIHMIEVLYFVDNMADTIKFYHSLLKNNGRLMIVIAAPNSGFDIRRQAAKELWNDSSAKPLTSRDVTACLKNQGLTFEEHLILSTVDISECFNPGSKTGERLLSSFTAKDHVSPEIRAAVLDLLRNKCSTEKGGRVLYNNNLSCILVYA